MSKQKAIAPGAWRRYQAVTASAADMIAEAATGNTYGVNCQCISLPLSYRICVCQIRFQGRAGRPQGITYSHQVSGPAQGRPQGSPHKRQVKPGSQALCKRREVLKRVE